MKHFIQVTKTDEINVDSNHGEGSKYLRNVDMYLYIHMSTKNIALREDVYKKLKEVKGPDESFSDAIEGLLKRNVSLLPLWSSLSESEALDLIETDLKAIRNGAKIRV